MSAVTEAGRRAISDLAARYGLSESAVEQMAHAVANGGGTMAQFNIPELGGSGQWMAGGMTMVGDMFNHGLQATVSNLCVELANAMVAGPFFLQPPSAGGMGGGNWWPSELGSPSSVGGQNQVRYAYFPMARRLAVDRGDGSEIVLLDTGDHQIGGFSQQQSGPSGGDPFVGLTFSSQFGQFALSSLQRVGGPAAQAEPAPSQEAPPFQEWREPEPVEPELPHETHAPEAFASEAFAPSPAAVQPSAPMGGDATALLETIERLAKLRDAGALTDEEFTAKKSELLARL